MRKKSIKMLITILIMIFCVFCISQNVFATDEDKGAFNTSTWDNASGSADSAAQNIMGTAINVIRIVATGISIIMISYIGIKYMMAAPSERADLKKSLVIFTVGAALVFASGNILAIIIDFADNTL